MYSIIITLIMITQVGIPRDLRLLITQISSHIFKNKQDPIVTDFVILICKVY